MDDKRRGGTFWEILREHDRAVLAGEATLRVFASGALLCTQGEPTTHVFVLRMGWVKILSVTSDGKEMLEALRGQGDVVGEIAGEVTGYRTATIQAVGPVHALLLTAENFGAFLDTHPAAARAYRTAMTERQRAAYESQRSHVLASGPQRLASLLLDLTVQPHSSPTSDESMLNVPLSQEELASLIGASRATVARILSGWRSRGIVRTRARHVAVLDERALRRIAGPPP